VSVLAQPAAAAAAAAAASPVYYPASPSELWFLPIGDFGGPASPEYFPASPSDNDNNDDEGCLLSITDVSQNDDLLPGSIFEWAPLSLPPPPRAYPAFLATATATPSTSLLAARVARHAAAFAAANAVAESRSIFDGAESAMRREAHKAKFERLNQQQQQQAKQQQELGEELNSLFFF
jgi:hypothetical protein